MHQSIVLLLKKGEKWKQHLISPHLRLLKNVFNTLNQVDNYCGDSVIGTPLIIVTVDL